MALNSELLTIIVCPNCRGETEYDEPGQTIECRECHYRYPVRDDIPVLLVDEAEKPAETGPPSVAEGPAAGSSAHAEGAVDAGSSADTEDAAGAETPTTGA